MPTNIMDLSRSRTTPLFLLLTPLYYLFRLLFLTMLLLLSRASLPSSFSLFRSFPQPLNFFLCHAFRALAITNSLFIPDPLPFFSQHFILVNPLFHFSHFVYSFCLYTSFCKAPNLLFILSCIFWISQYFCLVF
jgi:hypothetical protein